MDISRHINWTWISVMILVGLYDLNTKGCAQCRESVKATAGTYDPEGLRRTDAVLDSAGQALVARIDDLTEISRIERLTAFSRIANLTRSAADDSKDALSAGNADVKELSETYKNFRFGRKSLTAAGVTVLAVAAVAATTYTMQHDILSNENFKNLGLAIMGGAGGMLAMDYARKGARVFFKFFDRNTEFIESAVDQRFWLANYLTSGGRNLRKALGVLHIPNLYADLMATVNRQQKTTRDSLALIDLKLQKLQAAAQDLKDGNVAGAAENIVYIAKHLIIEFADIIGPANKPNGRPSAEVARELLQENIYLYFVKPILFDANVNEETITQLSQNIARAIQKITQASVHNPEIGKGIEEFVDELVLETLRNPPRLIEEE